VDTIYDYSRFGCFIAIWVLEDPLNLDGWKLSADGKCLNIGADGFFAFISSRVFATSKSASWLFTSAALGLL